MAQKELTPQEKAVQLKEEVVIALSKPFSIESYMANSNEVSDLDMELFKIGMKVMKGKFGVDFELHHNSKAEDVEAFIQMAKSMQIDVVSRKGVHVLLWEGVTKDGKRAEFTYSIYTSGMVTSTVIIEIHHAPEEVDILALVEAKVALYEKKEEALGTDLRVKMAKPEFMARQKGKSGIDVTHRPSSVQVSADYARLVFKQAIPKYAFGSHLNLLPEMLNLRDVLGLTDEEGKENREYKIAAEIGSNLVAIATKGVRDLEAIRKEHRNKAKRMMAKENIMNDASFIEAGMHQEEYDRYLESLANKDFYSDAMTDGQRKSLVKKAVTEHERYALKLANEANVRKLTNEFQQNVAEFNKKFGEDSNAEMKIAVATYIESYDDASDAKNHSALWDVLEFGLIAAIQNFGQEKVQVYAPNVKEQYVFFVHNSAQVLQDGLKELLAKKEGDEIRVILKDDAMGLDFESGFFPIKGSSKTHNVFPLLANDELFYTATIHYFKRNQTGNTGLSIQLKDFKLNGEAIASSVIDEIEAEEETREVLGNNHFVSFDMNEEMKELYAHYGEGLMTQEFVFRVEDGGTNGYLVHGGEHHLMMTSDEMIEDAEDLTLFSCDGRIALCK